MCWNAMMHAVSACADDEVVTARLRLFRLRGFGFIGLITYDGIEYDQYQ